MEKPILDPLLPYVGPIGGGGRFTPQKLVRIHGTVPGISYRFNINLQCGPNTSPQDDIALQISVRLLDGCICLNSMQHGIWDEEQTKTTVPIKRAEKFEIVILCEFSQYKVAINGQHYCEFSQKIHYDKITHLSIDGDVSIIQISYESASGGSTAGSSFTMPVAPIANESDDFEIVDNATAPLNGYRPPTSQFQPPPPSSGFPPRNSGIQPPQSGFQPPSSGFQPPSSGFYPPPNNSYPTKNPNGGFNDLPTYEETLQGPPYPIGPSAMHPTYPTGPPVMHPTYPTGPSVMHPQPMQPTYVSGLQPPPGTTIPLNAVGSNFRPVKRDNTVKACCTCFWIVIVVVVLIAVVFVAKGRKSRSTDSYSSSSYDNNYNSYSSNDNNDYWHKH